MEDGGVERGREADPGDVGHEQDARERGYAEEQDNGRKYREPERYDVDEAEQGRAHPKEEDGPESVQQELDDEDRQREFDARRREPSVPHR